MKFTKREEKVVLAVFTDLMQRFTDSEMNYFIGSETIEEMHKLRSKLKYADYCERHKIKYEDMTEADFEQAYYEENEI